MNVITIARTLLIAFILCVGVTAIAEVHGVLRVVKGNVQIKSGKTGQTGKARLGAEVYPKDTIITGKDSRAKIVMVDNNEINISPDSNVEIKNYEFNPAEGKKDVLLNVIYGKVRSKVEQKYDGKSSKFQVKTPSAVAGVRGTDFITGYSPATQATSVVTFHGAVELGLPTAGGGISNAVSVTPGKTAEVKAGAAAPTPPTSVPKEQLAKMDTESKAEAPAAKQQPSSRVPAELDKKGKKDKGSGPEQKGDAPKADAPKPDATAGAAPTTDGAQPTSAPSETTVAAPAPTGTAAPTGEAGAPAPIASPTGSTSSGTEAVRAPSSVAPPPIGAPPIGTVIPAPTTVTLAPMPTGSGMFNSGDFASGPGALVPEIPRPPSIPTVTSPLAPPIVTAPPVNQIINDLTGRTKSKLIINVTSP